MRLARIASIQIVPCDTEQPSVLPLCRLFAKTTEHHLLLRSTPEQLYTRQLRVAIGEWPAFADRSTGFFTEVRGVVACAEHQSPQ